MLLDQLDFMQQAFTLCEGRDYKGSKQKLHYQASVQETHFLPIMNTGLLINVWLGYLFKEAERTDRSLPFRYR
jgi:hypothetical protein